MRANGELRSDGGNVDLGGGINSESGLRLSLSQAAQCRRQWGPVLAERREAESGGLETLSRNPRSARRQSPDPTPHTLDCFLFGALLLTRLTGASG